MNAEKEEIRQVGEGEISAAAVVSYE